MKKFYNKLQNLIILPHILIFLTILVISILGFQVSKINAQYNTKLDQSLFIKGDVQIARDFSVDGNVIIGSGPYTGKKLSVYGKSNVGGLVFASTPGNSESNALATVDYINARIAALRNYNPRPSNPNPPGQTCYWKETSVSCSSTGPSWCESGYSAVEWYIDDMGAGGCFVNTKCCN